MLDFAFDLEKLEFIGFQNLTSGTNILEFLIPDTSINCLTNP